MRVLVLGCGPAGLMAAHAAKVCGAQVDIYSRRRKSELFGCQFLSAPIPGMTDVPPVEVSYSLQGDVEAYRRKVYGDIWDGDVSAETFAGDHTAWDIRRTYDNLWATYGVRTFHTNVDGEWLGQVLEVDGHKYDLVISSVPRNILCTGGHLFRSEQVWAIGDAPERGIFIPHNFLPHNLANGINRVVCNGLAEPSWYRAGRVFGYATVEWPLSAEDDAQMMEPAPSLVTKPLDHNCTCWPEVLFVGRYGRWEKGVLSHSAYQDVKARLVTESVS